MSINKRKCGIQKIENHLSPKEMTFSDLRILLMSGIFLNRVHVRLFKDKRNSNLFVHM